VRYLINRSDAIGDNILTMPMAEAIKELDPQAEVAVITSFICKDIYKNHPFVDKVFLFDKKESYIKKIKKCFAIFKEFKPDCYYYVGGSQTPNFVAWLKGIPLRGGILSRWTTFLVLNHGTRQKRSQVAQHEIFYNVDLLRHLDGFEKVDDKTYYPKISLQDNPSNYTEFKKELEVNGLDPNKEMIFIHPGMTGHTLNWPSRNYARLIKRLELLYPNKYNFIISHTPSDNPYLIGIKDELKAIEGMNSCVYYFNGAIKGLENYLTILKNASAFIGPSTGTTHLAATLKVPVVGIYSPIKAQSALRWGPSGFGKIEVVTPDVVCGEVLKCAGEACPYFECMSKIEVDDLLKKLRPILENTSDS
jgi:ADP-heptose:LPS heptosyltransferase